MKLYQFFLELLKYPRLNFKQMNNNTHRYWCVLIFSLNTGIKQYISPSSFTVLIYDQANLAWVKLWQGPTWEKKIHFSYFNKYSTYIITTKKILSDKPRCCIITEEHTPDLHIKCHYLVQGVKSYTGMTFRLKVKLQKKKFKKQLATINI